MIAQPAQPVADRRQFLLGGLVLIGAAAAEAMRPRAAAVPLDPHVLDLAVPDRIGPYRHLSQTDVILPPRDQTSLRIYEQYLARTYGGPALDPITLLIVRGGRQDYALQLHRPESCYPMAGYRIGPSHPVRLTVGTGEISATALTADRPGRREQLLYWTRVGDSFPTTLWAQRRAILGAAIHGRIVDGVMVRLSTPSTGAAAVRALAQFNALLLQAVRPAALPILLGTRASMLRAADATA